jgi:hypothetical protein
MSSSCITRLPLCFYFNEVPAQACCSSAKEVMQADVGAPAVLVLTLVSGVRTDGGARAVAVLAFCPHSSERACASTRSFNTCAVGR